MKIFREEANKENLKANKDVFVPFLKERDNIGRILLPKFSRKEEINALKMFENLKKSTEEYFFEKKYEKMVRKFNLLKKSLQHENQYRFDCHDFDEVFKKSMLFTKTKLPEKKSQFYYYSYPHQEIGTHFNLDFEDDQEIDQEINSEEGKEEFFVDLQEKINVKMQGIRRNLQKKHKLEDQKKQIETTHPKNSRIRKIQKEPVIDRFTQEKKRPQSQKKGNREFMETFCKNGKNYKYLVNEKKFDPWKKWYQVREIQIFPGKKIKSKNLEKSIYD